MATLTRANNDRTGLLAAVVVFVTALLVTLIGWFPLSLPARLLNRIFAVVVPGSCPGGYGSFLFGMCAATLGLLTMLGSVVVLALVFVFRGAISRAVRRVSTRLPSEARFLVTPVLATLTFTLAWAGNTFHFFSRPGIVVDGLFPAVVGLLTYVIYRYGPGWQRRLASLMDRRDNLSTWVRVGITAVVAWLFSMLVSSAYPAPVRDQVVVIVGMIIAYLLLAPRQAGMATMSPAGRRTEEGAP